MLENHNEEDINVFEQQYQTKGFASQRRYPNESLLAFLGGNYFHLPMQQRSQIKVLELGCGSGANLWVVAKEGFDAYGVDFSSTGLVLCEQMLQTWGCQATLKLDDITSLSFEDNSFDVIFDVVSMQHLTFEQHVQAYKEIYRCLKPGGKFFSYHLGENSVSLKSNNEMVDHCTVKDISDGYPLAHNGQACFLSANETRRMLGEAGLEKVVIEKYLRSYSNQTAYMEYLSMEAIKI